VNSTWGRVTCAYFLIEAARSRAAAALVLTLSSVTSGIWVAGFPLAPMEKMVVAFSFFFPLFLLIR
jgi:hypothetical protein